MLGTIMRGSLIESGGDLALWFNGRRPDHVDILERISILCQDDSSITLKLVASSIIQFIKVGKTKY